MIVDRKPATRRMRSRLRTNRGCQQLASVTEPLTRQTVLDYDACCGSLTKARDPLCHEICFSANDTGQVTAFTDVTNQGTELA